MAEAIEDSRAAMEPMWLTRKLTRKLLLPVIQKQDRNEGCSFSSSMTRFL